MPSGSTTAATAAATPRECYSFTLPITNAVILVILAVACVFFSFYDILKEQIFWSLGIYIPCFLLFGYGLFAWWFFFSAHQESETVEKRDDSKDNTAHHLRDKDLVDGKNNPDSDNSSNKHKQGESLWVAKATAKSARIHLLIFGCIMAVLAVGLELYGIVLCATISKDNENIIWGPLTIGFGLATIGLSCSCYYSLTNHYKNLRKETPIETRQQRKRRRGLFGMGFLQSMMIVTFLTLSAQHIVVEGLRENANAIAPPRFRRELVLPPLEAIADHPLLVGNDKSDSYSGPLNVLYTNDHASAEEWIQNHIYFSKENHQDSDTTKFVGWDMESTPNCTWRTQYYREDYTYFGPATLQLSTANAALVVPIAQDGFGPYHRKGAGGSCLPRFFHELLQDPDIIPVGVGIDGDLVELYRWGLEHNDVPPATAWASANGNTTCRRFDLGGIGQTSPFETSGVANLAARILGVELSKSGKLARTHWSKSRLNEREIAYAARDAWVGVAVLDRLVKIDPKRFSPTSVAKTIREQILPTTGDVDHQNRQEYPLFPICEVSKRQLERKSIKGQIKDLERCAWAEERAPAELEGYEELREKFRELAPTKAIAYELESLQL